MDDGVVVLSAVVDDAEGFLDGLLADQAERVDDAGGRATGRDLLDYSSRERERGCLLLEVEGAAIAAPGAFALRLRP